MSFRLCLIGVVVTVAYSVGVPALTVAIDWPQFRGRDAGVAANNPNAWLKKNFAPEEITTPTPDNRRQAQAVRSRPPGRASPKTAEPLVCRHRPPSARA